MFALPYLLLESLYIFLALFEQSKYRIHNKNLRIRVVCCVVFVVFFGLRGFIGWDFSSYYPMYVDCETVQSFSLGNINVEPGFYLYMMLIKSVWNNYHFYIFISILIDVIILNQVFKRYQYNYALCFVIYIAMMCSLEIDLQRNVKSVLLFLLSIKYIQERNLLRFIFMNLLGLSFHLSAILYFPCYLFLNKKLSKKTVLVIFIILEALYLTGANLFLSILNFVASSLGGIYGGLIDKYFENDNFALSKGISIGHLERMVSYLLILLNYNSIMSNKKYNVIFVNSFFIYFTVQILFNGLAVIADRLGILFVFAYIVVWPALLKCYSHYKLKQEIWFGFICLYSMLKVQGYYSGIFYKYDNILTGIESFEQRIKVFNSYSEEILKKNLGGNK